MSSLVEHASAELESAGWFDKDGMYHGMIGEAVIQLVKLFAEQGHSGMSAGIVRNLFNTVASYRPIEPLTGEDSEWMECGEQDGKPLYQNRRCSRVFKCGDEAYDIDGIVWRDPSGFTYTNKASRVPVKFPYTPTTEYRDKPE
jgi:hypothetical protein